jgi:probable HAF family extracellular repeat protein
MQNINPCFNKQSIWSVGYLCLLLFSTAKAETTYIVTDLGTLGGSYSSAQAINDWGQVVGNSFTGNSVLHAFLYSGGHMKDLGTLGGSYIEPKGINNHSQIVGYGYITGDGVYHADANCINDAGQIVGRTYIAGSSAYHAYLYSGGQMLDLGTGVFRR